MDSHPGAKPSSAAISRKPPNPKAMTDEELYEALCDEADMPHDSDLVDVLIALGYHPSNTK